MPKMNVTIVLVRDYENEHNWTLGEIKPNLHFFRLYFRNSTCEGSLQLFYAIVYILLPSAGYHFDGAVRHISDLAGKVISICDVVGGETKPHSLNATCKSYLFSDRAQSSSCLFIILYFRR
jgi:hypothetical protein